MSKIRDQNILIRVDGSHTIGLGHIYRMKTLAQALQQAGSQVTFLTKANKAANELLKTTELPCDVFTNNTYISILREVIETYQPALIIQDILATSDEMITTLRNLSSARIMHFDDTGAGLTMVDAVINSIVFHYGKYNAKECTTRLFEGSQYMILPPEVRPYLHAAKPIPEKIQHLLLAFGGTDTRFITARALEALNRLNENVSITINLGPASQFTERLQQAIKASCHEIALLYSTPNLMEEFFQADLVFCAGGNMLYELAALGVPSVSIAAEPHEVWNGRYWANIGTTLFVGWENGLDFHKVADAVEQLMNNKARRVDMARIGKQTIDGLGMSRIINVVEEVLS